jgi:hypothetical protein
VVLAWKGERRADATRSEQARRRWKGLFAQPHRRRIDQSSSDGSRMLERRRGSLVLGGAKKGGCGDITVAATGDDWTVRAGSGRPLGRAPGGGRGRGRLPGVKA